MEYVSFADQNHAPSLTDVRLEYRKKEPERWTFAKRDNRFRDEAAVTDQTDRA